MFISQNVLRIVLCSPLRWAVRWPAGGLPVSAAVEEYIKTCPTCQRVKADHLPPAGILFPLPMPKRRGVHQPRLGLHRAPDGPARRRSGHDFVQVYIDLLTGRVWLVRVPTTKTATAETAARNFAASVLRDVGLPDVLV